MSMVVISNVLAAVLTAPFLFLLSALSLNSVQRLTDWISSLAKGTGYTGYMKAIRPYARTVNQFLSRILHKDQITVSTENILLMSIVVAILALMLTVSELHSENVKNAKKEAKEAKKSRKERSD